MSPRVLTFVARASSQQESRPAESESPVTSSKHPSMPKLHHQLTHRHTAMADTIFLLGCQFSRTTGLIY
jgi:hypothetical protein